MLFRSSVTLLSNSWSISMHSTVQCGTMSYSIPLASHLQCLHFLLVCCCMLPEPSSPYQPNIFTKPPALWSTMRDSHVPFICGRLEHYAPPLWWSCTIVVPCTWKFLWHFVSVSFETGLAFANLFHKHFQPLRFLYIRIHGQGRVMLQTSNHFCKSIDQFQ